MHVSVRNLGAIRAAELDIQPLTLLIGPNNAGKTWLAYALAAILGPYGFGNYSDAYRDGAIPPCYPPLDSAIQQLIDEGSAKIDMVQFADTYGDQYFNAVAHAACGWLPRYLGTEIVSFNDLDIAIQIGASREHFLAHIQALATSEKLAVGQKRSDALVNMRKEANAPALYFYTSVHDALLDRLPLSAIREMMIDQVFLGLHLALYRTVRIFPTERATFINYPLPLMSEEVARALEEKTAYSMRPSLLGAPLSQFLLLMEKIRASSTAERTRQAETEPAIAEYIRLAQVLETILGGGVDFSAPEPDERRDLRFRCASGHDMEMSLVSSMVKELAPLVLYLRYLARPGELIVIDEPEMNLHPRAQAQVAELLAMLVNAGLHLLITTHSPYIVDHLGNLMAAASHPQPERIRSEFFLQRSEAFLPRDNVAAYLVDEGTARSILDDKNLVDWGTFSDISDRLTQIYFDM